MECSGAECKWEGDMDGPIGYVLPCEQEVRTYLKGAYPQDLKKSFSKKTLLFIMTVWKKTACVTCEE